MKCSISLKASLVMLFSLLLLTSCEDPIDATTQWRINNENSFKEYVSKEDYEKVSILDSSVYVYVKWLAHGGGKEYPTEISRIKCHCGMHMLMGNKVVDGNHDSERSAELTIDRGPKKQFMEGARIGLQQMVVGDEAEIIIP